jgi:protein TonB
MLLHLAVVLGLKFRPLDPGKLDVLKDKLPALEVVLVNAKTQSAPLEAQVLAQNNLDRGGDTDADKRMKTPLPAPSQQTLERAFKLVPKQDNANDHANKPSSKLAAAVAQKAQQVKQIEQQVKTVLSQLNSTPTPQASAPQVTADAHDTGFDARDMRARALNGEIRQLTAQVAKEYEEYQKRPKRLSYGANALGSSFAFYVDAWRQKVENIGNLNFPEEAKAQKIYGSLIMTVSLRADGSIEKLDVARSSGFKVLDDAARRIVELGAPYATFTPDMRNETDILEITRTWTFTREDTLSSK